MQSPDGSIEAFVVETNGGATTPFGYAVYVGRAGSSASWATEVAFLTSAMKGENDRGVHLRWQADNILAIECASARAAALHEPRIKVRGREVTTYLRDDLYLDIQPIGGR